jgi:soluble lytic murein transglycosylase-like protein
VIARRSNTRAPLPAVLLLSLASGSFAEAASPDGPAVVQPEAVQLLDLPALRRLFNPLARQRSSMEEGVRVAAWTDFSLLAEAIVGDTTAGSVAFDDLAAAATEARGPTVLATPGMVARDGLAYRLLALGYSARETADVISGRISQRALDTAQRMLMVGRGREAAANYLDEQYKRMEARTAPPGGLPGAPRGSGPGPFDAAIARYAVRHGVNPALVRAVISVESSFDPAARSHAGAVGLMQLMPATARELGVDPLLPEQNIEGGVRYLAALLRMFGSVELALVAYNGGPGFARRYARGETALYGETRGYVARVLARVRALRG